MEFKYKFNHDHLQDAEEQIWEMKEEHGGRQVYDDLSPYEYEQIADYLPDRLFWQDGTPIKVLEMGCGLGRGSIYLNHKLDNPFIKWFLADRDGFSKENTGAFKPKEDEYYCSFERTKSFANLNGLKHFWMFDTEEDDWAQLPKMDFIFSFCSLGMHVPIERYIERLIGASSLDVTMVFGTRHSGYNDKSFSDRFKEVIFKPSAGDPKFPIENWLILRGLK